MFARILSLSTPLIALSSAVAIEAGWPDVVHVPEDFELTITSEETFADAVFRTNHFVFTADSPLPQDLVIELSLVLETTYAALRTVPLPWFPKEPPSDLALRFFTDETAYLESGGLENSAGVFLHNQRRVLVRLDPELIEHYKPGQLEESTLIHEVVHQLQSVWLDDFPRWLSEGIAVYMESVPYERGQFHFGKIDFRNCTYLDYHVANQAKIVSLQRLFKIGAEEWNSILESDHYSLRRYYRTAFLLVYYLIHLSPNRETHLHPYFRGIADENSSIFAERMGYSSPLDLEQSLQRAYEKLDFRVTILQGERVRIDEL